MEERSSNPPPPREPSSPSHRADAILGGLFGDHLGLGAGFAKDRLDSRFRGYGQMSRKRSRRRSWRPFRSSNCRAKQSLDKHDRHSQPTLIGQRVLSHVANKPAVPGIATRNEIRGHNQSLLKRR